MSQLNESESLYKIKELNPLEEWQQLLPEKKELEFPLSIIELISRLCISKND